MTNTDFIAPSNKIGRELGDKVFRAFLLAGERFITADMDRKDTLEAGFASFYKNIDQDDQKLMAGYFKKQARLDLSQRVQVLGDLTKLSIATPLALPNPTARLGMEWKERLLGT